MDFHLVRTKDPYIDVIVPLKKRDFFLTSFLMISLTSQDLSTAKYFNVY